MAKDTVTRTAVSAGALLRRYGDGTGYGASAYTDAYTVTVTGAISLERYIAAFYSTRLFRLERFILGLAGLGTNDTEVEELACGERQRFAAWNVEARADNELLLCDVRERTRSWLMTEIGASDTRLYFGSAVVLNESRNGKASVTWYFRGLFPLHRMYSRALLAAARRQLKSQQLAS
ncbi:MAG: hypothetical protein AAGC71_15095 [Pseudomonadota bacterium]